MNRCFGSDLHITKYLNKCTSIFLLGMEASSGSNQGRKITELRTSENELTDTMTQRLFICEIFLLSPLEPFGVQKAI